MLKKLIALLTLAAIPFAVQADESSLYGSYWDAEELDEGYGGGAKLEFSLGPPLALDLRGSWITFDDSDLTVIPIEASLLLRLPMGEIIPYGGVGAPS